MTEANRPVVPERTADEESKVHFRYVLSTYTVNVFFLLQIVVGAALTALYVYSKHFSATLGLFNKQLLERMSCDLTLG